MCQDRFVATPRDILDYAHDTSAKEAKRAVKTMRNAHVAAVAPIRAALTWYKSSASLLSSVFRILQKRLR